MAVIPKQVVSSLANRLEPDSQISYLWVTDPGGGGRRERLETHTLPGPELVHRVGPRSVVALRITLARTRHPVDVVAVGPWTVSIRPHCGFPGCRCDSIDHGHPLRASGVAILGRAREVAAAADREYPRNRSRVLPSFPEHREPPPPPEWLFDEEFDDDWDPDWFEEPQVDDPDGWGSQPSLPDRLHSSPEERDDESLPERTQSPWSGLQDLLNPPANWSPSHAALAAAIGSVVDGEDLLVDLCPDDDAWSIRRSARRLAAGLDDLKMLDVPTRGNEREWIADRVRVSAEPHRSMVELWAGLDSARAEAVVQSVATAVWLFDGVPSSGTAWCEQAAILLDEAAESVPDSVRARIGDPLELLVSAGLELASGCLDGEVPGVDVTGLDLWFRTGAAFAELAARGPIIGANERGDLPAAGVVVVLGDVEARRSYLDAIELGIDGQASVRICDVEPSGPHLAALAIARGGRSVLLNLPEGESLFADHASLPHIRVEVERGGRHQERVAQQVQALVDRWSALTPVGRDSWWESQPHLYLPALVHALLLDDPLPIPSTKVIDALDEDQLIGLISRAAALGLDSVADRLRSLAGMGSSGTTGLSLRITFSAAVPDEPVVRALEFHPERLRSNAVFLPPAATARVHAAADVAETGAAILWDSAGHTGAGPGWMARRTGQLVVLGFRNLDSTALSLDDLRGVTVVGLPGCGDLSPLAGRSIDVAPGEAAMVVEGSTTLIEPTDVVLGGAVRSARRDGLARQAASIVLGRIDG